MVLVYGRVPADGVTMPVPRKPVYMIVGEGHGMANHPGGLSRAVVLAAAHAIEQEGR